MLVDELPESLTDIIEEEAERPVPTPVLQYIPRSWPPKEPYRYVGRRLLVGLRLLRRAAFVSAAGTLCAGIGLSLAHDFSGTLLMAIGGAVLACYVPLRRRDVAKAKI